MRTALLVAMVGCIVLAGCTGSTAPGSAPRTTAEEATTTTNDGSSTAIAPEYDVYTFDHAGVDEPAIEGGIAYPTEYEPVNGSRYYATVVANESAADRFDHGVLEPNASAFVNETDFDESYLLVIQSFPGSSVPDFRVESVVRQDDDLRVRINDSANYATADITVETVIVRVERGNRSLPSTVTVTTEDGISFSAGEGVVRPDSDDDTDNESKDLTLPITDQDESKNLADPVALRVRNEGDEVNGYSVTIAYTFTPDCRESEPACGRPSERRSIVAARGKLRPGTSVTVEDAIARPGNYTVTITAELPDGEGSRRTVEKTVTWTVEDTDDSLTVVITDDGIEVGNESSSGG